VTELLEGPPVPATYFALALQRRSTASGGWEWFLTLAGEPVYFGGSQQVGIFTEKDAKPAEVFPRLLAQAVRTVAP
jgi:hypothetical protein